MTVMLTVSRSARAGTLSVYVAPLDPRALISPPAAPRRVVTDAFCSTLSSSAAMSAVTKPSLVPARAETVAVPGRTARARPASLTVMRVVSELDQSGVCPAMGRPRWSSTVAVSCCVSPTCSVSAAGAI